MGTRIQIILAQAGVASRRGAEALILAGRVTVNGQVVSTLGAKADPKVDRIELDGRPLKPQEDLLYYMFHKPAGYLTTMSDPQGRKTIVTFLAPLKTRVYPIGRLDYDVSGILILTNHGELARRLSHPSFEVPKVYRAITKGQPDPKDLELLASGRLLIGDRPAAPARARIIKTGPDRDWLELILTEGRHRQVKRMLSAVGHPVQTLKRVAYGPIWLDPQLSAGAIRPLDATESLALKSLVGLIS
ncbi:MAG: rRNA pseudouridine synthase [Deltaproteobacteria bacterium]|jgi:23S rRNA pseudouridine2605 synthase|nr:rRNA pseudouridine synthase [Deltaproteobacteria bacterium]